MLCADQRSCRLLGTPHADDCADIEDLPYYRANFPQWPAKKLHLTLPLLSAEGVDLVQVSASH